MGYKQDGSLKDLFPEEFVKRGAWEITHHVAGRMRDGAAKRTPVARLPEAYHGDYGAWRQDRGGRQPRTMRDSWTKKPVRVVDNVYSVEVENTDPKTEYVEWDTRPHLIRAKMRVDPKTGKLRQGSLRFPDGPSFRYAVEVNHPGTQGVHMMRDTMAEVAVMWPRWAERILKRLAVELNRR